MKLFHQHFLTYHHPCPLYQGSNNGPTGKEKQPMDLRMYASGLQYYIYLDREPRNTINFSSSFFVCSMTSYSLTPILSSLYQCATCRQESLLPLSWPDYINGLTWAPSPRSRIPCHKRVSECPSKRPSIEKPARCQNPFIACHGPWPLPRLINFHTSHELITT